MYEEFTISSMRRLQCSFFIIKHCFKKLLRLVCTLTLYITYQLDFIRPVSSVIITALCLMVHPISDLSVIFIMFYSDDIFCELYSLSAVDVDQFDEEEVEFEKNQPCLYRLLVATYFAMVARWVGGKRLFNADKKISSFTHSPRKDNATQASKLMGHHSL